MSFNSYFYCLKNSIEEIVINTGKSHYIENDFDFDLYSTRIKIKFFSFFLNKSDKSNDDFYISLMKDIKLGSLFFIKKIYTIYDVYLWGDDINKEKLFNSFKNLVLFLLTDYHLMRLRSTYIENEVDKKNNLDHFKSDFKEILNQGINKNYKDIIKNPILFSKFLDFILSPGFKVFCKLKIKNYKIEIMNKLDVKTTSDYNKINDDFIIDYLLNDLLIIENIKRFADFICIIKYDTNKVLNKEIYPIIEYFNILNENSETFKNIFNKHLTGKVINFTNIIHVDDMEETFFNIDLVKYFKIIFLNDNEYSYTYPIFLNKLKLFISYLFSTLRNCAKEYNGSFVQLFKSLLIKYEIIELNNLIYDDKNSDINDIKNINIKKEYIYELFHFLEISDENIKEFLNYKNIEKIKNEIKNIFIGENTNIFIYLYEMFEPLIIKNNIIEKFNRVNTFKKVISIIEKIFNFKIDEEIEKFLYDNYNTFVTKLISEININDFSPKLMKEDMYYLDSELNFTSKIFVSINNYFGFEFVESLTKKLDNLFNFLLKFKIEPKIIKKTILMNK